MRIHSLPAAIHAVTSFGPLRPISLAEELGLAGPLDVSDPQVFDRWCLTGAHDTRTLEEFAADGGHPMFPSNRNVP